MLQADSKKNYEEKPKIIGLLSEFGRIGYVTKREKFKKKMTDKTFKPILVGYVENHTWETYRLYNPDTKRFIMTKVVKWEDWKMTNKEETLNIFCKVHTKCWCQV